MGAKLVRASGINHKYLLGCRVVSANYQHQTSVMSIAYQTDRVVIHLQTDPSFIPSEVYPTSRNALLTPGLLDVVHRVCVGP